ncbi:hypothetical protein BC937DRAFT_95474 [Endogone sp. FLAS-F59071]|nr:hypothetical protein BC937DRAFT_95474 [Endogone sp. FLAS-F59071]|eukprot:RUS20322.1 hypothetical protein BC937DRAFT_95474 [Endogone sp. FLAS-F59071]
MAKLTSLLDIACGSATKLTSNPRFAITSFRPLIRIWNESIWRSAIIKLDEFSSPKLSGISTDSIVHTCKTDARRSIPMPVSTHGIGSASSTPSAVRKFCMKTKFQISSHLERIFRTQESRSGLALASIQLCAPVPPFTFRGWSRPVCPRRSQCTARMVLPRRPSTRSCPQHRTAQFGLPLGPPDHAKSQKIPGRFPKRCFANGRERIIRREYATQYNVLQPKTTTHTYVTRSRQKVPGVSNGLGLGVQTEGEVAEHLEKGVVAGGMAHIIEVIVLAFGDLTRGYDRQSVGIVV